MDYQQKASALKALAEISLKTRGINNWYVQQSVEVGRRDSCVLSSPYGNGETPESAINDHWRQLVDELSPGCYIVINAMIADRRQHVRWNGFMWEILPLQ